MDKKYLLIGGIALFAAWWFFFREKDEAEPTTGIDQPEGNEEADEEENTTTGTTETYAPRSSRGTGITATPATPVNRTGTGNRSNTGRGTGRTVVEPIKYHFEAKTVTVNRNE